MNSAKEHVKEFLHGSGKHTAELHSHQNQAVTHEHVKPTQEENVNRAVDREVHEEHHQTEVQPIHHKEVKATEHHHNVAPVESHHHHHGQDSQVKEKLGAIAGAFGDKRKVEETSHVQGHESEIVGEHHHHHVHHTVQPVVKQETIQPHVVHTTVPVHERIDMEPTIHGATVAKPISMDQFKQQVGVGGGEHKHETVHYQGDPLNINKDADVGFMHGRSRVDPSQHDKSNTGLTSGLTGGTTGNILGGAREATEMRGDDRRHHGVGSSTGVPAGAAAAAAAAAHHHQDGQGGGFTGSHGRGNDYAPIGGAGQTGTTGTLGQDRDITSTGHGHHHHDQSGQTIGATASQLGHRDDTSSEHRKMPGEYVHGSSAASTASDTVPRTHDEHDTHGHGATNTSSRQAANPTGFMDGRSPNDNKTETGEKSGGMISNLINKMKS